MIRLWASNTLPCGQTVPTCQKLSSLSLHLLILTREKSYSPQGLPPGEIHNPTSTMQVYSNQDLSPQRIPGTVRFIYLLL